MELAGIIVSTILSFIAIGVSIYTFISNKRYHIMDNQPHFKVTRIQDNQIKRQQRFYLFLTELNDSPFIVKSVMLEDGTKGGWIGRSNITSKSKGEIADGYVLYINVSEEDVVNSRAIIKYEDFEGKERSVVSDVINIENGKNLSLVEGDSLVIK